MDRRRRKGWIRKGKGKNKRWVKVVIDKDKIKHAAIVACKICFEQWDLAVIINYGSDNFDMFAKNEILIKCPVCHYERPRCDPFTGKDFWVPYHIEGIKKRVDAYTERRDAQPDDPEKWIRYNG